MKKNVTPKRKNDVQKPKRQPRNRTKQRNFFVSASELPDWFKNIKQNHVDGIRTQESEPLKDFDPKFVLKAGTYDVVLLVDTAEVAGGNQGGKKSRKEITLNELKANGVVFETRKLNIGDFCWIARQKVGIDPNSIRQDKPKELVLPYVVERKRLDDLKSSIIDGRYKEQKFRLRQSGIKNIIYLVEGYGKHKKYWASKSNSATMTNSAIASTSLMEGFKVEITSDQRESMMFLTVFTRTLIERYDTRDVFACSKNDIEMNLINDVKVNLMTFVEFNDSSRKQKPLNSTELFQRMLMKIYGVTPATSKGITDKYPTLGKLFEALESCETLKEKEELLSEIRCQGKKIRPGIAKVLVALLTEKTLI